jgi:hypothetical protein
MGQGAIDLGEGCARARADEHLCLFPFIPGHGYLLAEVRYAANAITAASTACATRFMNP